MSLYLYKYNDAEMEFTKGGEEDVRGFKRGDKES